MRTSHGRALSGALSSVLGVLGVLGLTACPSQTPPSGPDLSAAPDLAPTPELPDLTPPLPDLTPPPPPDLAPSANEFKALVQSKLQRDLDVLFLIDNSPSMSAKQQALAAAMPTFIQTLSLSGANYQIGVATSDVGSWTARATPWPVAVGTCNSFEGDDGELQRLPCNARSGLSQDAVSACQTLCPDPTFVPQGGVGFISRINGVTNVPKSLVNGVDIGPQRAFQCIGLVGDNGCGIEGQLEGAKRALDGHNPRNAGFPRPGSVLALVLLTDEDDCSVSLTGRAENNPVTRDCAAPDQNASYDCYNLDYRCLARSTQCNEALNTSGTKTGCSERAASYLESVDTYVKFFSSLRPASKLLVSGIYARTPLNQGGRLVVNYERATNTSPDLNRATGANAACVNAQDPKIFARPQHRLSRFTRSFKGSVEIDVCDPTRYQDALVFVADAIQSKLAPQCLPAVPRQVTVNGQRVPDCVVGDVSELAPDMAPATTFPACSATCCDAWAAAPAPSPYDAALKAACASDPAGAASACYCAVPSTAGLCTAGAIAGVIRKGGPDTAPAGTVVSFHCQK